MSSKTKHVLVGVIVALILYHFYMQSQAKGGKE